MENPEQEFSVVWQSLSDTQRRFLLSAYEIDKRLPHSDGLSKIMPPMSWRTVGLMSRVPLDETDDLVRELADLNLVQIIDSQKCEMWLACSLQLFFFQQDRAKRRWNWIGWIIFTLIVGVGLLWQLMHRHP